MRADYTETLRNLMINEQTKNLLNKALSTYPLYQPAKEYDLIPTREELNNRLLNHYKYREIGFETVGRFLDELEITMCEIMPRYNEMFKTVAIMADIDDPFGNVDIVETFEQERSDTSETSSEHNSQNTTSGNSTSNGSAKVIRSDTPQDLLTKNGDEWELDYASEAGLNTNKDTSQSTGTSTTENSENASVESNGTVKHTLTRKGNQGVNTYAHDMNEFRTSIIDVVNDIINDDRIAELFLMVY